jgi:hypothetical protein
MRTYFTPPSKLRKLLSQTLKVQLFFILCLDYGVRLIFSKAKKALLYGVPFLFFSILYVISSSIDVKQVKNGGGSAKKKAATCATAVPSVLHTRRPSGALSLFCLDVSHLPENQREEGRSTEISKLPLLPLCH